MMILVRKSMQEKLLLRMEASSTHGNGFIYVTDMAVAYEVDCRGVFLNFIPRKLIKRITVVGGVLGAKKLRMEWDEDEAMHFFEFRTRNHSKLLEEFDTK